MKSNWQNFVAWLKSKSAITHSVGVALFGFAVAYDSSKTLQENVAGLFTGHPEIVTKIGLICTNVVLLAGIVAKYSHSSSNAGTVANAQAILAKPDAPTATQVEAASTTK